MSRLDLTGQHCLIEQFWENTNAENLRLLMCKILSWLETDIRSNRFNETGLQLCLESIVRELSRPAQKRRLCVKAHFNQDMHECDLLFALEPDVASCADGGDTSHPGKAALIELKRLISAEINIDDAFADAKANTASNCLTGKSDNDLLALRVKGNPKSWYKATNVAGVVNYAKKQVRKQANELRKNPQWSESCYEMHQFVVLLIVDRVIVDSVESA